MPTLVHSCLGPWGLPDYYNCLVHARIFFVGWSFERVVDFTFFSKFSYSSHLKSIIIIFLSIFFFCFCPFLTPLNMMCARAHVYIFSLFFIHIWFVFFLISKYLNSIPFYQIIIIIIKIMIISTILTEIWVRGILYWRSGLRIHECV